MQKLQILVVVLPATSGRSFCIFKGNVMARFIVSWSVLAYIGALYVLVAVDTWCTLEGWTCQCALGWVVCIGKGRYRVDVVTSGCVVCVGTSGVH